MHDSRPQIPFLAKIILLFIVAVLGLIGLLGLVLPIIPGIVFLVLAGGLLARIWGRPLTGPESGEPGKVQPGIRRYRHASAFLSVAGRLKLTLLIAAATVLDAVNSLADLVRRRKQG